MKKSEVLDYWKSLKRRRKFASAPVPYKHKGSTFDQDGIRITGSRKFIDAVLSRLTDIQVHERGEDGKRLRQRPGWA